MRFQEPRGGVCHTTLWLHTSAAEGVPPRKKPRCYPSQTTVLTREQQLRSAARQYIRRCTVEHMSNAPLFHQHSRAR